MVKNYLPDIFLTEQSIKELLEGKIIYDEEATIHPPKTNFLKLMIKKE